MASSDFIDPYLDPSTGILRNFAGATASQEFAQAEADFVVPRILQIGSLTTVTPNLQGFCTIHHFLFQDLFDWAGKIRTVDIRKNVEGSEFFLPVSFIGRAAQFAGEELESDGLLQGLPRQQFIERLAYHYDQWNYIHPFREGNGRTQRVFWSRITKQAGWNLKWQHITGAENDEASRVAANTRNLTMLIDMFTNAITPS
jgi:cell filamentation protein